MRRVLPLLFVLSACAAPPAVDAGMGADTGMTDDASRPDATILETCSVLSAFELSAISAPARDSNGYVAPSVSETEALRGAILALVAGDLGVAEARAADAGYVLCRGEGAEDGLELLAPATAAEGAARIALRRSGASLALEAPHPLNDAATVAESVALFSTLGARALIASGTHRCANPRSAGCDGVSSVCATDEPYRESDAAHAVDGTFHAAHLAVAEAYPEDLFISVHGMGGAGISISDGTTDALASSTAPSARIARALSARFADVTSCNDGAGVPRTVRLCGTTNVQGRHLNRSADACGQAASSSSEHFVHLEQSRAVRDAPAVVAAALSEALGI